MKNLNAAYPTPQAPADALFPASAAVRVLVTHTRPEHFAGTLWPLLGNMASKPVVGYTNHGHPLDENGMLLANRCTWAHVVAAARGRGFRRRRALRSPAAAIRRCRSLRRAHRGCMAGTTNNDASDPSEEGYRRAIVLVHVCVATHRANALPMDGEPWSFPELAQGRRSQASGTRHQGWRAAAAVIGQHALKGRAPFGIGGDAG